MFTDKMGGAITRRELLACTAGLGLAALAESFPAAALAQKSPTQMAGFRAIQKMPLRLTKQIDLARLTQSHIQFLQPHLAKVRISAESRNKAAAHVANAKKAASFRRDAATRAKIAALDASMKKKGAVLKARLDNRPKRTPEAIIGRWMKSVNGPGPRAETVFTLQSNPTSLASVSTKVHQALRSNAAAGYAASGVSVESLFPNQLKDTLFVLRLRVAPETIGKDIHNLAASIRQQTGLLRVIPDRTLALYQGAGPTVDKNQKLSNDIQWHIKQMKIREAWRVPVRNAGGKLRGEGAIIGHPDMGWRPHIEYNQSQIDKDRQANTVGDTILVGGSCAIHGIPSNSFPNWAVTHGTGTGTLMVSADNPLGSNPAAKQDPVAEFQGIDVKKQSLNVCGVAPAATIVPIKCVADPDALGVIRLGSVALARAIQYAVDIGVDVISISLGGVSHPAIDAAVARAIDNNVIICAAAGQSYGLVYALSPDDTVIEPAGLPGVIAVAGSTINGLAWKDSHYGPEVVITAPSYGVWHGTFGVFGDEVVECAEGTSFSTALTASTCALWIAYWGRDFLRKKYKTAKLAHVFRVVVQKSANNPNGAWDTARFGAGLIDAEALLRQPLPDDNQVPIPPPPKRNTIAIAGDVVRDVVDAWNVAEDLAQDSVNLAANLANAATIVARQAAEETMNWLADQYAAASELVTQAAGEVAQKAGQFVNATGQLINDAAEATEDAAAKAAQEGEDAVDSAVHTVENIADSAGEVAGDVWHALFG